jgi:acetylornithine deacetylase/succinyl-diaminopimelate desuccinylase family protein
MIDALLSRLDNEYTLRLLSDMIRIPSAVGNEGQLARYLQAELSALDLKSELHEVEPDRPNVYARLKGAAPGRRLHFNGHTDTVEVCRGWTTDPFDPVVKENRIYGLGACDMKAGLACVLAMFRAFVESGYQFAGELSFSAVVDEEGLAAGARGLMATGHADYDAVVLGEPYAGDEEMPIPLGITGKILYDVTVAGRAAHGFRPHLGTNAIEEAARILAALDRLPLRHDPRFGQGNTCTLKIEGGYQAYSVVVPDHCRFEVNRLLVPGETTEGAVHELEALIGELGLAAKVEVRLKPPRYEPFVMDKSEVIFQIFDEVYHQEMGIAPVYDYSRGITDANVFAEGGMPCLHLGPARGNVHQPDEYVDLDWLARLPRMYTLIAARFLGGGDPGTTPADESA